MHAVESFTAVPLFLSRRPSKGEPPFEITGSRSYGDSLYLSISFLPPPSFSDSTWPPSLVARFLEKVSSRLELGRNGNGRCMYRPGFRYLLTVSNMSLVPYRNRYTPVVPSQILIVLIACAVRGEDKRRILCCYDIERNLANAIS